MCTGDVTLCTVVLSTPVCNMICLIVLYVTKQISQIKLRYEMYTLHGIVAGDGHGMMHGFMQSTVCLLPRISSPVSVSVSLQPLVPFMIPSAPQDSLHGPMS